MLKIKGNREFFHWWEHWMSRLHPNHTLISDSKSRKNTGGKGAPTVQASGKKKNANTHRSAPVSPRPSEAGTVPSHRMRRNDV